MKRSIARWIATLSTAAAFGLPAIAVAQTPEPQTPPQQTPPQQAPSQDQRPSQQPPAQSQPAEPAAVQPDADQAASPEEHLKQANAALDRIQSTALTSETRTKLAELKRHMSALERGSEGGAASRGSEGGAASRGSEGGAASTKGKTPASTDRANASWGTEVAAMDKILAELLGPDSSTGTKGMTGTTAAPGAAGTTGSKAAATVALDEATRSALTEVRSHIVAFAAGKSGTATPKGDAAMASPKADTPATTPAQEPSAAAAAAAPASQPAAAPATEPAAAPATEPAAARATEPAAAPEPEPTAAPSTAAAAPQQPADQEAARRHLLAARDALNQLTQLPAAAQLTGDTREQVSQLIANFNELITTQSQWRASYAKVTSNLTALLGPDTKGADIPTATGLPPAASESTAAPGAVGTSGVAAAAEMDPSVRAKLVELRRNLTEFETALGGPEK
jgi:hypothetical protein